MSNSSSPTSSSNRICPPVAGHFAVHRKLSGPKHFLHTLLSLALTLWVFAGCLKTDSYMQIQISKGANPWTHLNLCNDPDEFHFAIVADRTGVHQPGVFEDAAKKLNLLRPEFIISVGDFIEGYSDDEAKLDQQWDEFNSIVGKLQMPFFYVPGNHDVGNDLTAQKWQERLGRTYYHFVYRDVLFLCLNTESPYQGRISNQQIEYFEDVLSHHRHIRWTFVFMHHPVWLGQAYEGWLKFQSLLEDRPYTVFAGHQHSYFKSRQDDRAHYILSMTGGRGGGEGGKPAGFARCQFNHIVWVTMSDNGPVVTNLLLEGILDDSPCP